MVRDFTKWVETTLDSIVTADRMRRVVPTDNRRGPYISSDGRNFLNLSSNDYLGLASDSEIFKRFMKEVDSDLSRYAFSSTSSRLLTGNSPSMDELEKKLGDLYGKEALLLNSGYHANSGIIPALVGRNDIIFSDKLNHASIVDGTLLSRSKTVRFRHCDYNHLESLLKKNRADGKRALIISESIFSMDGDRADIKKLIELRDRYDAVLYIDEAHAVGAYGENGLGLCQVTGTVDKIDIIVGTFGKALASLGAFAAVDSKVKALLVNTVRPFIFTTALPPIVASWTLHILNLSEEMEERRKRLRTISGRIRKCVEKIGIPTAGDTHIVPLITGDNSSAINLAELFRNEGLLVSAIRPPTVPENGSRLRISLSANLEEQHIQKICTTLDKLWK